MRDAFGHGAVGYKVLLISIAPTYAQKYAIFPLRTLGRYPR